jgi:hypothetical protein
LWFDTDLEILLKRLKHLDDVCRNGATANGVLELSLYLNTADSIKHLAIAMGGNDIRDLISHHQPINVPTAEAQAFLMKLQSQSDEKSRG